MNKYTLRRSPLAITIGSILAAGPAHAAIITVTTAADGPIGSVEGCSLREAVASANESNSQGGCASGSPLADTIVFDAALAGSTITLSHGVIEITSSLTITGPVPGDPAGLTIDGDNLSRIFHVQGPSPVTPINANFNRLTLTRGRHAGAAGVLELGGAVHARYANLHLENTLVTGNSVSTTAAGFDAIAFAGGGGIGAHYGGVTLLGSAVVGNSTVAEASGDHSSAAVGGAITVLFGAVSIADSTISGNHSESRASGEHAGASAGGALLLGGGGLVMVGSSVSGNNAQAQASGPEARSIAYGGALALIRSNANIVDSTLSVNSVTADNLAYGGALAILQSDTALRNSTISGNTASANDVRGGGAMVEGYEDIYGGDHYPANLSLTHTTVAFNTPGGVYATDNAQTGFVLVNSLVVPGSAGGSACEGSVPVYANSLATDDSCTGTATVPADIRLAGLANNGGFTPTHALLPGSAAIDGAGDCGAEVGVTADQRGRPRPAAGSAACDIGAFELEPDLIFSDRFEQSKF